MPAHPTFTFSAPWTHSQFVWTPSGRLVKFLDQKDYDSTKVVCECHVKTM